MQLYLVLQSFYILRDVMFFIPDIPIPIPVITSITVDTFGIDYGMPETLTPFDAQNWFMQNYGTMLQ